ncbi:hypothetical protein HHK36_012027 [Tetracentron sinense]|uniref:Uncharacterized protein n=1 Tax=Tetracentron sinense TaxID=13715 RepID=A0A835DHT8_TETSI|nr:hypothetical protein HHK36_012027 [Tetracentron sinense]
MNKAQRNKIKYDAECLLLNVLFLNLRLKVQDVRRPVDMKCMTEYGILSEYKLLANNIFFSEIEKQLVSRIRAFISISQVKGTKHGLDMGLTMGFSGLSLTMVHGVFMGVAQVEALSVLGVPVLGTGKGTDETYTYVICMCDFGKFKGSDGASIGDTNLVKKENKPLPRKWFAKVEVDSNTKKSVQIAKNVEKLGADSNPKKSISEKVAGDNRVIKEKKLPKKEAVEKDKEASVSLLNIQVGLIRKAWKHPFEDSLLVEEIDLGDVKLRQVVSRLAKYCSPDELTNRWVILITNVKPGKLRGEMSEGLVLCASNKDHTIVEPLLPPEGEGGSVFHLQGTRESQKIAVFVEKKKKTTLFITILIIGGDGDRTGEGNPVLTCCGHLFCWPCLYEWLHVHSDTKECPVCKGEVTDMSTTPVYGRGNNTQEPNKESGLKVPPRPQARRIESFRQNIQIEEMIRRINNRLDVTREWAPNQDLEGVLIMPERTNSLANPINTSRGVRREGSGQHPLLEPSLIVQPENIVDLSQGSVASSEAEGSSAFTSLLRRRSQSQRAAALSFALTFAQRRFEAHFHSHSGRRNHEQSPPAEDRDSVSSIASVIQSESQTMDTATEIDSTVSSPSSSFRIRNDVLRVSDVDAGVSRAPRRRRLN